MNNINIAIVDDHHLFRSGMVQLVKSLNSSFVVMLEAENGKVFLEQLKSNVIPDIVLLDISMPIMDGFKTAKALYKLYPDLKILIVSMNEDEPSLIKMLKFGVKGFVGKDIEPEELRMAISKVLHDGFYYSDKMTEHLINTLQPKEQKSIIEALNEREMEFLVIACSERTYKEIAEEMCLSTKTIQGYRDSVFSKLKIKSRVGLVMFAIKSNLIKL
jgi:two-component system invasion response regulator UvrY